jgi:hypothetical protein
MRICSVFALLLAIQNVCYCPGWRSISVAGTRSCYVLSSRCRTPSPGSIDLEAVNETANQLNGKKYSDIADSLLCIMVIKRG